VVRSSVLVDTEYLEGTSSNIGLFFLFFLLRPGPANHDYRCAPRNVSCTADGVMADGFEVHEVDAEPLSDDGRDGEDSLLGSDDEGTFDSEAIRCVGSPPLPARSAASAVPCSASQRVAYPLSTPPPRSVSLIDYLTHRQLPAMERVVAKMLEQKKQNLLELEEEAREVKQMLKIKMAAKETTGVDLYALQQQLAKVQKQLRVADVEVTETATTRADAEEIAAEQAILVARNQAMIAKQKEQQAQLQKELDKWERRVRTAELAHEERDDKLKIVQRAASTAENAVSELEKAKTEQDLYIDRLTEQARQLEVDVQLYEAQLSSQREETSVANGTLAEAAEQMGAIEFEKTQLRQQWQTALIGMNKRDQALLETNVALEKRREERLTVESELRGMKNEQRTIRREIDGLSGVTGKLEGERLVYVEKIKVLEKERGAFVSVALLASCALAPSPARLGRVRSRPSVRPSVLRVFPPRSPSLHSLPPSLAFASAAASDQRFNMLRSSLEQTDAESETLLLKKKGLVDSISQLERAIENVDRERQKVEEAAKLNKGDETTVSKAVSNMADEARALQRQMHGVEMDIASCENETERINLDMLNTVAHTKQLQSTVDGLREELKEKDRLIEKYDQVARQRHDTINKKMAQVDFLNRKLGAMTSGVEEENLGPLEATIHNMQKEIERMRSESAELQRQWLQGQINLVAMVTKIDKQRLTLRQDEGRQAVLVSSKVRLNANISNVRVRVNNMMKETQAMHNDMARLNRLLAKNTQDQVRMPSLAFVLSRLSARSSCARSPSFSPPLSPSLSTGGTVE
jgi:chromosome segregation ATPase